MPVKSKIVYDPTISVEENAKKCGVSDNAIRYYIRTRGIDRRYHGSLNLIEELRNYTWAKDKDGNPLNIPIDKFNHLLDALRYGVWSKFGQRAGYGQYNISVR